MQTYAMKSDTELKSNVLAELKYEPTVTATDIGVLVDDGAVTLNGYTTSYSQKCDAVRAAKRVAGVRAIADDIKVKFAGSSEHTDGDIARAAANAIGWSPSIPANAVNVTVRDGWITLDGQLEYGYQRNLTEDAVKYLLGSKGVSNLITIKPVPSPIGIEMAIDAAFERNALLDAEKVEVEVSGNKVILRGKVHNHAERDEAGRVAWNAPGVFSVDNQITVDWSWGFGE